MKRWRRKGKMEGSSSSSSSSMPAAAKFILHSHRKKWWRWLLFCGLMLLFSILCGLALGISAIVISKIPPHHHYYSSRMIPQISIDCRIISAGIDLRSAKICEALDNEQLRSRFRCYFEYYWASVFKVEIKPHASKHAIQVETEVPREALPFHCRPGFAQVWVVKESHQVNETYQCKYTLGRLGTVEISEDLFSYCRPEDISVFKLIRQACYMLFFSEQWIFSATSQSGIFLYNASNYILVGAVHSVFIVGFTKIVSKLRLILVGHSQSSNMEMVHFESRCIIIATTLCVIWCIGHLGRSNSLTAAIWTFEDIHRTLSGLLKTVMNIV